MARNKAGFEGLVPGWEKMTDEQILAALVGQRVGATPPAEPSPAAAAPPTQGTGYSVAALPPIPPELAPPAAAGDAPTPGWWEQMELDGEYLDRETDNLMATLGLPAVPGHDWVWKIARSRVEKLARRAVREGVAARTFVCPSTGKTHDLVLTQDKVLK